MPTRYYKTLKARQDIGLPNKTPMRFMEAARVAGMTIGVYKTDDPDEWKFLQHAGRQFAVEQITPQEFAQLLNLPRPSELTGQVPTGGQVGYDSHLANRQAEAKPAEAPSELTKSEQRALEQEQFDKISQVEKDGAIEPEILEQSEHIPETVPSYADLAEVLGNDLSVDDLRQMVKLGAPPRKGGVYDVKAWSAWVDENGVPGNKSK